MCLPVEEGGCIGLRNAKVWNKRQLLLQFCKILRKSPSLWASWINTTALKRHHIWTMSVPTDCSWIWRKVLQLRPHTKQFLSYKLGNGLQTSLWFDPWWQNICLASNNQDAIISQTSLSQSTMVHSLISTGSWILPIPRATIHHPHAGLTNWLTTFNYPAFDLGKEDSILWDGVDIRKIKTWYIWDSLRNRGENCLFQICLAQITGL